MPGCLVGRLVGRFSRGKSAGGRAGWGWVCRDDFEVASPDALSGIAALAEVVERRREI